MWSAKCWNGRRALRSQHLRRRASSDPGRIRLRQSHRPVACRSRPRRGLWRGGRRSARSGRLSVHREYYVNDAGRQMDILAASVWLRYLELCGENVRYFPSTVTRAITSGTSPPICTARNGDAFRHTAATVFDGMPAERTNAAAAATKRLHIDALIARAKQLLGATALPQGIRSWPQRDPR